MFASDTYFTFVYIFPMAVLFTLYYNRAIIKALGITVVVMNVGKVVFQILHGHASDTDITSYIVQMAAIVVFSIGIYAVTSLTISINEEKVSKLLENNKNIAELAEQQRLASLEGAELVRNISDIIPALASASGQVAAGSQNLAQGSTEQAASVEELSSSVLEVAQKTKENAAMAEKAAMLANDIKISAEKGSNQMNEMMTAVKDINDSSHNISKVIKSIDDIAFQTNILALNAAVEAARAGQHGKGFAVVADEVRNLAAKSAEAAKDTEGLISDSIEKADLGSRIADETAASLMEIVAGIDESSRLMVEIAKSSEEQSDDIVQINKGIEQVAHVTQQNAATAQQSAATSQEMNGQSAMLQNLVSRFEKKENRHHEAKLLQEQTAGSYGKY
jgi:methyl-accepting chemotaxis protein